MRRASLLLLVFLASSGLAEGPPTCKLSTPGELLAARSEIINALVEDRYWDKNPNPEFRRKKTPERSFGSLELCLARVRKFLPDNEMMKRCFSRALDFADTYAGPRGYSSAMSSRDYMPKVPERHLRYPESLKTPEFLDLLFTPKPPAGKPVTDRKGVLDYVRRVNLDRGKAGEEPILATWFKHRAPSIDSTEGPDRLSLVIPERVEGGVVYQFANFTTLSREQEEKARQPGNQRFYPEQIGIVSTFVPDDPKKRAQTYYLDAKRDYTKSPPAFISAVAARKSHGGSPMNCNSCHSAKANRVFPINPSLAGDDKKIVRVLEKITARQPEAPFLFGDPFRQGIFFPNQSDIPPDFFKECAESRAVAGKVHGAFSCRDCHDGENGHRIDLGPGDYSFEAMFGHYLRDGRMPPGEGEKLLPNEREALLRCVMSFADIKTVEKYLLLDEKACHASGGAPHEGFRGLSH